ncbi:MAG TPA: SAM-dependent methyltransferase [Proteiniclasticum sp.]|uniref:SAM-dependent methyltransferase n=1 Tax=Proteiniclasticum sp. TaxID=2053595 RepID=UPI000E8F1F72|nr:cyclopropane-fatty-acyl-phospholipid synthase family protein [Proteiniclasticum sp.]HBW12571.1 SAM-dependent methyltransferase [Proteiniclasticum sp.]
MRFEPLLEKNLLPDFMIRWGARLITRARCKEITVTDVEKHRKEFLSYVAELKNQPIAINTKDANEQHYEQPTEFFEKVLGSRMKYSCGYWEEELPYRDWKHHLDASEEAMLKLTCQRAEISDGQSILDLGCGWGSLSLYMAEKYPHSQIVAVSNSATQKAYIDEKAKERGFENLTVYTEDINTFAIEKKFQRVVSVEMFEHMRNYEKLMEKVSGFLLPDGKLFVHIFTHKTTPYSYEVRSENDWMTKYFFSGGTMPSQDLLHYFSERFSLEKQWAVSGTHYSKTLEAWLQKMDEKKDEIMLLMEQVEGKKEALKWFVFWRTFFLASSEFFAYREGNEWYISHYLFRKTTL